MRWLHLEKNDFPLIQDARTMEINFLIFSVEISLLKMHENKLEADFLFIYSIVFVLNWQYSKDTIKKKSQRGSKNSITAGLNDRVFASFCAWQIYKV